MRLWEDSIHRSFEQDESILKLISEIKRALDNLASIEKCVEYLFVMDVVTASDTAYILEEEEGVRHTPSLMGVISNERILSLELVLLSEKHSLH